MNAELEGMLQRTEELLRDLEMEYKECLHSTRVTERAKNLTHEVLERLRSALDHTMCRLWEKHIISPDTEQRSIRIYFPITDDLHSFDSMMGRMAISKAEHKTIYEFLLARQPFSSEENRWLALMTKVAGEGKHIRLVPQKRLESRRIKVSGSAGSASWDPSTVKFRAGVSVVGAPIDPATQRVVPTPGVTEKIEVWVSFNLEDYNVNALGFCQQACQKTRGLIQETCRLLN